MHKIKWIRENAEQFRAGLRKRNYEDITDSVISMDAEQRVLKQHIDDLISKKKSHSNELMQIKSSQNVALLDELKQQINNIDAEIEGKKRNFDELNERLKIILENIPNLLLDDVPNGLSEKENVVIGTYGKIRQFEFSPQAHDVVGKNIGLSMEDGALLSGSRFVVLKKDLARMERAVAAFMLDIHREDGYEEISLPYVVKTETMYGAGQLPKFQNEAFKTADGRWLIPTSEVPLVNLINSKMLEEDELPMRFTAYTPCFRLEAGAAGKHNHGLIRVHQFNKVELVSITVPDKSLDEHERMLSSARKILDKLELPYRVLLLCSGDTGFCSSKTYDLEVFFPSKNDYVEISSCSNCRDFQSVRMDAKVKCKNGEKIYPHTLNSSGLAVGRTIAAIIEDYQQADGSIAIPSVLQKYMNQSIMQTA